MSIGSISHLDFSGDLYSFFKSDDVSLEDKRLEMNRYIQVKYLVLGILGKISCAAASQW